MGYAVVDPDDLEATPDRPCVQRALGDAVGLSALAVNVYEADPGEEIPLAYHYHDEQEELFYVLDGEMAVETPEGELTVSAGECFAAEPESPHLARNPDTATDRLRVLAVGAPNVDDVHPYEP